MISWWHAARVNMFGLNGRELQLSHKRVINPLLTLIILNKGVWIWVKIEMWCWKFCVWEQLIKNWNRFSTLEIKTEKFSMRWINYLRTIKAIKCSSSMLNPFIFSNISLENAIAAPKVIQGHVRWQVLKTAESVDSLLGSLKMAHLNLTNKKSNK